jgi:hypothetical protein
LPNKNYFLKFEFLSSPSQVRTYFERGFPNADVPEEELYVMVGDKDGKPGKRVMEAYGESGPNRRYPVTLVGHMRLSGRWLVNMLERELSPEFFDVLSWFGQATVAWLRNVVSSELISALFSFGKHREPKLYYVFAPVALDDDALIPSLSNQSTLVSELESKYIEHLLSLGFGAATCARGIAFKTLKEYYDYAKRSREPQPHRDPNIDAARPLTARDLLTFLVGGKAWDERRGTLELIADREGNAANLKLIKASYIEHIRYRLHNRNKLVRYNKRLLREDWRYQRVSSRMGPDPRLVLMRLYNALPDPKSVSSVEGTRMVLPNGRCLRVREDKWEEEEGGRGLKGEGSIDLVNQLSGYPVDDISQAAHELSCHFGGKTVSKAVSGQLLRWFLPPALKTLSRLPFPLPEASEERWEEGLGRLSGFTAIPEAALRLFHDKGLILCDRAGGTHFVCDRGSGSFRLAFPGPGPGKAFLEAPNPNALPFFLPGLSPRLVIAPDPVMALRAKLHDFDSGALAYGRFMALDRLPPYLEGKELKIIPAVNKPVRRPPKSGLRKPPPKPPLRALPRGLPSFLARKKIRYAKVWELP